MVSYCFVISYLYMYSKYISYPIHIYFSLQNLHKSTIHVHFRFKSHLFIYVYTSTQLQKPVTVFLPNDQRNHTNFATTPGVSKLSAACHCNSSEPFPFQWSTALEFQARWRRNMTGLLLWQNGRDVTSHTITGKWSKNTRMHRNNTINASYLYINIYIYIHNI